MIYKRARKHTRTPEGFFHLEEEKTGMKVTGFGNGENFQLKDEYGNLWVGTATRNPDNSVAYRFRNAKGKVLTGTSDNAVVTLRDEKGHTWKGFVD
jgi:hypothetical protein